MKTKVLFLHGWFSTGTIKSFYIRSLGYDVYAPSLSNWSFSKAVKEAQSAYDTFCPDVIVGSSRGGAVAMNIDSNKTPMVLMAPAWRSFGKIDSLNKPNVIIMHSEFDSTIGHNRSYQLVQNSILGIRLITVGSDHTLNCKNSRRTLKTAISELLYLTKQPKQTRRRNV